MGTIGAKPELCDEVLGVEQPESDCAQPGAEDVVTGGVPWSILAGAAGLAGSTGVGDLPSGGQSKRYNAQLCDGCPRPGALRTKTEASQPSSGAVALAISCSPSMRCVAIRVARNSSLVSQWTLRSAWPAAGA